MSTKTMDRPASGQRSGKTRQRQEARPPLRTPYYFAYGSNLDMTQMGRRCPTARPLGTLTLTGWRLEFKGVADIVPCKGGKVHGAVYVIGPRDEEALDVYEGFRAGNPLAGMYRKEYRPFSDENGTRREVMFYVMNAGYVCPPSAGYLGTIARGYGDWGLDTSTLDAAVGRSRATSRDAEQARALSATANSGVGLFDEGWDDNDPFGEW